jgi:hypothetical protein
MRGKNSRARAGAAKSLTTTTPIGSIGLAAISTLISLSSCGASDTPSGAIRGSGGAGLATTTDHAGAGFLNPVSVGGTNSNSNAGTGPSGGAALAPPPSWCAHRDLDTTCATGAFATVQIFTLDPASQSCTAEVVPYCALDTFATNAIGCQLACEQRASSSNCPSRLPSSTSCTDETLLCVFDYVSGCLCAGADERGCTGQMASGCTTATSGSGGTPGVSSLPWTCECHSGSWACSPLAVSSNLKPPN